MTLLKKLVFSLIALAATSSSIVHAKRTPKPTEQTILGFKITNLLESQAADNTYTLSQSLGHELAKILKTPSAPTASQIRVQAFQDWFCRVQGSKLRKTAQVATWFTGVGTIFWVGAMIRSAITTDYVQPTLHEQASHAAFSLAALAIQTYITERAGLNSSKPLTIGDILEIVKGFARKQAQPKESQPLTDKEIEEQLQRILSAVTAQKKHAAQEEETSFAIPQETQREVQEEAETLQDFFS